MSKISPEKLKELGNQAAKKYLDDGTNLTSAVISVLSGLGCRKEHIKRVCEFANEIAFLSEFHKGGDLRNVTFKGGPADPSAVIKELMDGAGTPPLEEATMKMSTNKDYGSKVKVASVPIPEDVEQLHEKLHKTASYLADKRRVYEYEYDELCDKIAHEVKSLRDQEVKDNFIWHAIKLSSDNDYMANLITHELQQRLENFKPNPIAKIAANHSLNPKHPLAELIPAFSKIAFATLSYKEAARIASDNYKYFLTKFNEVQG